MSGRHNNRERDIIASTQCPQCGAMKGYPCRTIDGKRLTPPGDPNCTRPIVHTERRRRWQEAKRVIG